MSTNNYILNLLNIKDENIHIITECKENVIKNKNYKIIEGILTYNPQYCPCCGIVNKSTNDIIKWGFRKNCIVKIPRQGNCLTRLMLHKQRFFCKHCNNTFIAETNLVDKNKNIELPFISIIRVTDPQPGTARSNIKNIAGDRHYFHYKVPTNDGNREGFDIYKIPQPLPVDIKYEIKIFSFNIELLNDFNLMFQKKYKSGDLYIKPNGIWMSTKIENPSDNSSLGSINQRKYYSQTIVLTVKGWVIDPDDFIIEKGITRVVNDIYIDTLSNKSKVNVIQNENQSIFNLLLKDNLPQPVIEIQYKNYNDFIINNLIMNENITSYEIFSYGNKLFDSQKNSLPITISGGDKIVFRLIKDDIIDNLKLEFECVYV